VITFSKCDSKCRPIYPWQEICVTARCSSGEMAGSAVCVLMYKDWSHSSKQFVKIFRCQPADVSVCILMIGTYLSHKMHISTEVRSSTYPRPHPARSPANDNADNFIFIHFILWRLHWTSDCSHVNHRPRDCMNIHGVDKRYSGDQYHS